MSRPSRRARARPIGLILTLVLAGFLAGCGGTRDVHATRSGAATLAAGALRHARGPVATIHVTATAVGQAVPDGFLGLSVEYRNLESYAGSNPAALDPAFVQLLRNLAPGSDPVLRIGGDSTDWTWWPIPGTPKPGGVRFALDSNWAAVARSLAAATGAHLILGIDFEADNRAVAGYEARQLLSHIGRAPVRAFELGNEPELYAAFPWYRTTSGRHVYGRSRAYSPTALVSDWSSVVSTLPAGIPVAGPSVGGPEYLSALGDFESREPRLGLATIHAYPLKHCNSEHFASPQDFFKPAALSGLAGHIAGLVAVSRAHGLPLRVDEMNSISCGGQKGLSQAFAPALWALDMLPRILRAGAAGVNFHTVPNTNQALIGAEQTPSGWRVSVEPEYLGLAAFAQAAPVGARLLHVTAEGGSGLDAWAARSSRGQTHVVLINPGPSLRSIRVTVAGAGGAGSVHWLRAPSLGATSGATLGGFGIDPATGGFVGHLVLSAVRPSGGAYAVEVPAHSAAILTVAS